MHTRKSAAYTWPDSKLALQLQSEAYTYLPIIYTKLGYRDSGFRPENPTVNAIAKYSITITIQLSV